MPFLERDRERPRTARLSADRTSCKFSASSSQAMTTSSRLSPLIYTPGCSRPRPATCCARISRQPHRPGVHPVRQLHLHSMGVLLFVSTLSPCLPFRLQFQLCCLQKKHKRMSTSPHEHVILATAACVYLSANVRVVRCWCPCPRANSRGGDKNEESG